MRRAIPDWMLFAPPSADHRARRLATRRHVAFHRLWDALRAQTTTGPFECTPANRLLHDFATLAHKCADVWEQRCRMLEQRLRAALASQGLTPADRERILRGRVR